MKNKHALRNRFNKGEINHCNKEQLCDYVTTETKNKHKEALRKRINKGVIGICGSGDHRL